jgi:hypothetical protein
MSRRLIVLDRLKRYGCICASAVLIAAAAAQTPPKKDHSLGYDDTPFQPGGKWRVHDVSRPRPRMVTAGTESSQERPGRPPSDAIVLFDGTELSKWATRAKGQANEPRWKVENGYMEVMPATGGIETKEKFGDIQLHLDWAAPAEISGASQTRGNSGVMLMGRYEIQVLDSYENPIYADGQAASIYGQVPPPVNVSRKPGEWQTFDIVFEPGHAARQGGHLRASWSERATTAAESRQQSAVPQYLGKEVVGLVDVLLSQFKADRGDGVATGPERLAPFPRAQNLGSGFSSVSIRGVERVFLKFPKIQYLLATDGHRKHG